MRMENSKQRSRPGTMEIELWKIDGVAYVEGATAESAHK